MRDSKDLVHDIVGLAKNELLLDNIVSLMYNMPSETCASNEVGFHSDVIYFKDDSILDEDGEMLIDLSDGFIDDRPQIEYSINYDLSNKLLNKILRMLDAEKVVIVE